MSKVLPASVQSLQVPLYLHSDGYNTQLIRQDINTAISGHHPVIVVAHSFGAFLAYEIHSSYAADDVQFIYVDPPYNFPLARLGSMASIATSVKNATDLEPLRMDKLILLTLMLCGMK
jgi:16S rRNA G966 N2-methylase RsmD